MIHSIWTSADIGRLHGPDSPAQICHSCCADLAEQEAVKV